MRTAEIAPTRARIVVRRSSTSTAAVAWRNLWRNKRRTWLTAGGIAFAVFLLVFANGMQSGTFNTMVDNGARLLTGHLQLQHPSYQDDPRVEYRIGGVERLLGRLHENDHVIAASARAQGFALASSGERSFGAQVTGVDFQEETLWSSLPSMVTDGRYLQASGEAFVGAALARNLGLTVGNELVLLGTTPDGSVAATVATVVGLFNTGIVALDRGLAQIPLTDFREAWNLAPDEAHLVVAVTDSAPASEAIAATFATSGVRALAWDKLMVEAKQTMDLKSISANLFFGLVALIVTFSVVNSLMMTVFERTPEFGVLGAIGMRPIKVATMLQLEALWLAVLGVLVGFLLSGAVFSAIAAGGGVPLPEDAQVIARQYHMPDRLLPKFSTSTALLAGGVMIAATQVASLLPALRIFRLRPVEALRGTQ